MYHCGPHGKEFHEEFKRRAPDAHLSEGAARRLALQWSKRFEESGHVFDNRRRRPKLSDDEVRRIAAELTRQHLVEITASKAKGRGHNRRLVFYKVVRHKGQSSLKSFCLERPELVKGLHHKTVLRRLRQVCRSPKLLYKARRPVEPLSEENRKRRLRWCSDMLSGMGGVYLNLHPTIHVDPLLHKLFRVCFIDAKTYYICPSTRKVWAFAGTDTQDIDPRMVGAGKRKVVYYAVVNAILGPVYWELVTGTTEHSQDPYHQVYMVSCLPHSP